MAASVIPATITEQVANAKDMEISYRTLHPSVLLHDIQSNRTIRIPYASITNKYKHFLHQIIATFDMYEEDKEIYMFNPKRLSYDLYGTTELWNDLLLLNHCISAATFKPDKNFSCYDPNKFKSVLNEIIIIEEGALF